MFVGEHEHTLDGKGRVILPSKYRERLRNGIVLAQGKDYCVDVYPVDEFRRIGERKQAEVEAGQLPRSELRLFAAGAFEDIPDSQGRVTVPPKLRTYAGLDRELTINGAFSHVQIWDRDAWTAYNEAHEAGYARGDDA